MTSSKPKVTVLICDDSLGAQNFLDTTKLPELTMIADINTIVINHKNSAEINIDTWEKLIEAIYQHRNKVDGFVVIHGTDGLLYTGTVISFFLNGFNKPIIFTGTLPRFDIDKSMEMRANIINAIQAATYPSSEVGLIFGNKFLRITQARIGESAINLFDAPEKAVLGKIDFSIRVFEKIFHNKVPYKDRPALPLEKNIVELKLSPIFSIQHFKKIIEDKKAVVIDTSTYNYLPEKLADEIINQAKSKVIVLWSKNLNLPHKISSQIIIEKTLTWHATVAKLIWACSVGKNPKQIRTLMEKKLDHEIL